MNEVKQIDTTVIYHDNCTDGFMSAFVYWFAVKHGIIKEEVEYIACQYNKPIPVMAGKRVLVLDFSFSKEQLMDENFRGKVVEIHDHHESSANQYGGYGTTNHICGVDDSVSLIASFTKDKSGARLAYDLVYNGASEQHKYWFDTNMKRVKFVVDCVMDRDLWKFTLPDTRAVYELLNSIFKNFETWNQVIYIDSEIVFRKELTKAETRISMRTELATSYASKAHIVPYKDSTIAIVNCPSNFASEVGSILAKEHAFAMMFVISPESKLFIGSLRSRSDGGEDVSLIAGQHGGGGHVNAAGFTFNYTLDTIKMLKALNGALFQ